MAEPSSGLAHDGGTLPDWRALYLEAGDNALSCVQAGLRVELAERGLSKRTAATYVGYVVRAEQCLRAQGTTVLTASDEELARFALTLPASARCNVGSALRHLFRIYGRPAMLPAAFSDPRRHKKSSPAHPGRKPGSPRSGHEWELDDGPASERVKAARSHMRRKGLAPKSVRVYADILWRAEQWAAGRGKALGELDADELGDYSDSMGGWHRRGLRSALRHYYAALAIVDPPIDAVRVPRKPRMIAHPLEQLEARHLYETALADDGPRGTVALLGLLLGLRCSEIAQLRFDHFDDGGLWLRFVGKGELEATLPVPEVVWSRISTMPRGSSPFVFPGKGAGSHVHPATVWGWVRSLGVDAGIDGLYTHKLRHTCLSIANDATADLRGVQEFARHADPDTTAGYTRVTGARLTSIQRAILSELGQDVPAPEPTLPISALAAGMFGLEAVEPWQALSLALSRRPGWQLELAPDGHRSMHFRHGDRLWATAETCFRNRPPQFVIFQQVSDDEDDAAWWDFADAESLAAVLSPFESGEVLPFPPTGSAFGAPGVAAVAP